MKPAEYGDTRPPCPFAAGDRLRVARPDNPKHPRAGQVGTVKGAPRWFPPVFSFKGGEPRLREEGCYMVLLHFASATWDGWQSRGDHDEAYPMFARELERA